MPQTGDGACGPQSVVFVVSPKASPGPNMFLFNSLMLCLDHFYSGWLRRGVAEEFLAAYVDRSPQQILTSLVEKLSTGTQKAAFVEKTI